MKKLLFILAMAVGLSCAASGDGLCNIVSGVAGNEAVKDLLGGKATAFVPIALISWLGPDPFGLAGRDGFPGVLMSLSNDMSRISAMIGYSYYDKEKSVYTEIPLEEFHYYWDRGPWPKSSFQAGTSFGSFALMGSFDLSLSLSLGGLLYGDMKDFDFFVGYINTVESADKEESIKGIEDLKELKVAVLPYLFGGMHLFLGSHFLAPSVSIGADADRYIADLGVRYLYPGMGLSAAAAFRYGKSKFEDDVPNLLNLQIEVRKQWAERIVISLFYSKKVLTGSQEWEKEKACLKLAFSL